MKLLLHACCAPCLTYSYGVLSEEHDVTAFWYNPNIHPYREYEKRLESLELFSEKKGIEVIYDTDYPLKGCLEGMIEKENRCKFCYRKRLYKTAEYASDRGFEAFSTTLTISPYQDHDLIKSIGEEIEEILDIGFVYKDLREGFSKSHQISREMGLYMQGYCGCIFSEKERYKK